MAKIKTTLERYRSIRRPTVSGGGGGLSSSLNSLAKKQQSAEDAIIDDQYEQGLISAEAYQTELTKRLVRTTLTPLQQVNLKDKIVKVGQAVADASYDRAYSAKEITSDQYLAYQKEKLNRIPQTDTTAYQNQAKIVQNITDKAEREKRQEYRISEQLRISRLPEDTSERIAQKAALYETLENQARLDGDYGQADTFAITKNNYLNASKQAAASDRLRSFRQSVSEQEPAGLGVPSATTGQQLLSGQSAVSGAGKPGTNVAGQPSSVVPGKPASPGAYSPAVASGFKSLDKAGKQLDSYYQDISNAQGWQQQYEQEAQIARSEGRVDDAEQYEIQANNYVNRVKEIQNNIVNTESRIEEIQIRIQEAQAAAVKRQIDSETSQTNNEITRTMLRLDEAMQDGKISARYYLAEKNELQKARVELTKRASGLYGNIGEIKESGDWESKYYAESEKQEATENTYRNRGNWGLVAITSGEKPGKFRVVDLGAHKLYGTLDTSFIRTRAIGKDKNGKPVDLGYDIFHKIDYPGQEVDENGLPIPKLDNEILAKTFGEKATALVWNNEKQKLDKVEVRFVDENGRTVAKTKKQLDESGKYKFNPVTKKYEPLSAKGESKLLSQAGKVTKDLVTNVNKGITSVTTPQFLNQAKKNASNIVKGVYTANKLLTPIAYPGLAGEQLSKPIQEFINKNIAPTVKQGFEKVKTGFQGLLTKGGEFVKSAISGLPTIVPRAEASYKKGKEGVSATPVKGVPKDVVNDISEALREQGIYSPQTLAYALATVEHETGGTFRPIEEFSGREQAQRLGYSGGKNYFGRGYIQLTHDYNYEDIGNQIGVDLLNHPELALNPKVAAKILAVFFKNRGTAQEVQKGNFRGARKTINPDNKGDYIANLAKGFYNTVTSKLKSGLPQKVQPGKKPSITPIPTPTPIAGASVGATFRPTQVSKPVSQPSRPSPVQQAQSFVNQAARNIQQFFAPQQPKIISPIPGWKPPPPKPAPIQQFVSNVQKAAAPVIKQVQKAAAPVVQTVQKAAQNVGKFLGGLFGRR